MKKEIKGKFFQIFQESSVPEIFCYSFSLTETLFVTQLKFKTVLKMAAFLPDYVVEEW